MKRFNDPKKGVTTVEKITLFGDTVLTSRVTLIVKRDRLTVDFSVPSHLPAGLDFDEILRIASLGLLSEIKSAVRRLALQLDTVDRELASRELAAAECDLNRIIEARRALALKDGLL